MNNPEFDEYDGVAIGWITPVLHKISFWATWPRRCCIGDRLLIDHSEANIAAESRRRARRADTFVAVCLFLDLAAVLMIDRFRPPGIWLATPFLAWRISDVMFTALHDTLFGEFFRESHSVVNRVPARVVTLGLLSYLELVLCFGGIYSGWPEFIQAHDKDFLTPFHLSFITQLTIGYGDVFPLRALRMVTWVQGMCSIVLLVFLIDKYLGELRRSKP
jgi:hypothetical protein